MKITIVYEDGQWVVRNKGRIIRSYARWSSFNKAMDNLDNLKAQLLWTSSFCDDCKPTQEVSRG
jgi:hypothetical protein